MEANDYRSPLHAELKNFQRLCEADKAKADKAGDSSLRRPLSEVAVECGLSGELTTIPLNRMDWYTPAPAYQFESSRRSLRRTPEL